MSSDQFFPEENKDPEESGRESLTADESASSLMDRLHAAWDNREPKWYERLAPAQKHWVDKLVAIRLEEFQSHLTALDREDSQLAHEIAELTAQIVQLNRRIASLESRLDKWEANLPTDREE